MNKDECVPNVVARRSLALSQPVSEMSSTFSNKCHVRSKKSRRGKAIGSADIGGSKDGCKNIQQKVSKKQQLHVKASTSRRFKLLTENVKLNKTKLGRKWWRRKKRRDVRMCAGGAILDLSIIS
ncbi:hypothetical protein ACH5RR_034350 [Cinchona calisaya]|uniref:Uncharacterized protein n=1 Tax=Cinchona calisaya TaxID=153742 RepID=A0ABD2YAN6_9GENT